MTAEAANGRKRRRWWTSIILLCCLLAAAGVWWLVHPKAPAVQLVTVRRQTMQNQIFTAGTVKPTQRQVVMMDQLSAPFDHFDVATGQTVQSGQALITLENSSQAAALTAARQTETSAENTLAQAQAEYQAASAVMKPQLYAAVANAQTALAQAQAQLNQAQAAYNATFIRAQFSGTVLTENPGGLDSQGNAAPLLELVGRQNEVVLDVSEVDAVHLRKGMSADITSEAFPGKTWTGHVQTVASFATEDSSGTGQVEVDVAVPKGFPVPLGYQVNVNIVSASHTKVPVIPYDALVQQGSAYEVFVYRQGRVQAQSVTLGITGTDAVEVTQGLTPGEQVVLNPPSGLTNGEAVNVRD
ncbi:efflux RND transporter periplasmic adaptor subunit [Alicyclobacillus cycloheptanicus]|uniref:HlyD family secretion protein n=1 Tax=Alicyclobacillus cycloheptanicus TaxID=1457 RepID=A0ABT9XG11_9BACL|nr:efflux RND transporter periplasmic adaptor subunit [Alicyclobacillus cycloheptanicus]MDQ0189235.1 HlyD family secretion protein [Alicyclobacillus cycloheptanicus]WDM00419.1 efflux RND transporter periplasmic adaptor subunit [Alicyclobacillus cycloheptanicus]